MNIIFVSNNMAKARTVTMRQVAMLLLVLLILPFALILLFILPQPANQHHAVNSLSQATLQNPQQHLDALAIQLGQMQARVMRLDALSERLAKMAGIKEKDIKTELPPGRGGPESKSVPITEAQLKVQIAQLTQEIDRRTDHLSLLEALLLQQSLQKNMLPDGKPVDAGYKSSSYGWRVDPFSGRMAFHEGIDFTASKGSPIYAAAGGLVTTAERMADYGNIIKIDHGAGLETRYAHASVLLVRVGERVKKGQMIAQVGSTGRSTGAHLHFEVRLNGAALDPRKYLSNRAS